MLLYFPPPLCSHMHLMWLDSNILQISLVFRWLRGSLITRFLTIPSCFHVSCLSDSLLLYISTTWRLCSFNLQGFGTPNRPPRQIRFLKVYWALLAKQELLVWQAKQLYFNTSQEEQKSAPIINVSVPVNIKIQPTHFAWTVTVLVPITRWDLFLKDYEGWVTFFRIKGIKKKKNRPMRNRFGGLMVSWKATSFVS